MKSTTKPIQLDKSKLFGFNQTGSDKSGSKNKFSKPMIGGKAVGVKGPPPVDSAES
ncbi:MAG TPA: hypothetical protein VFM25_07510 [Verrucomicrobiae bacterium]|jgi:hypothetical protein|nr:hypothetical protein [Verrucomicrobiae bacterium]